MNEKEQQFFEYLSISDQKSFLEIINDFKAAGLETPIMLGSDGGSKNSGQKINPSKAKLKFIVANLASVELHYDGNFKKMQKKISLRNKLRLSAALIGTIASSSLLVMFGNNVGDLWKILAAGIALISSLVAIVENHITNNSSGYWDSIAEAGALREIARNMKIDAELRLKTNDFSEQHVNEIYEKSQDIVVNIMTKIRNMEIAEARGQ